MSPYEARLVRNTALTILALVALRLVGRRLDPLTFDEAYYWMWSKHLAGGYYDHPPGVALVIRLGTMIAGDTELGVRLVSILLALPMSWAVYRTAMILFGGQRLAATATILLNVTLMAAVGTMIVTPDAPLLVASSFVLFFSPKYWRPGAAHGGLRSAPRSARRCCRNTPRCFSGRRSSSGWSRSETAALADFALAVSWRPRCAGCYFHPSFSGTPITIGSPSSSRSAAPGSRISSRHSSAN